jgi:two-component system CitB family sensor kinase
MVAMSRRRGAGPASVAQQLLLLQTLVLAVMIICALLLAVTDARSDSESQAQDRAIAVAVTVADAPIIEASLADPTPTTRLQPFAERVRLDSGTDFVVIMSPAGIRYTHPDPTNIGKPFLGSIDRAQQGQTQTEHYTGTLGPSVRAVVPVIRGGRVIALVGVGITLQKIDAAVRGSLPLIGAAALLVLALGVAGTVLINRRLRRQTHGMGEAEITRMYEYYDSVLRSVREGLLLLDRDDRIQLINDEGARLLGLDRSVTGRRIGDTSLPATLRDALVAPETLDDEIHLVGDRMLVVNRRAADRSGRALGSVVTFRDHTELQTMAGELDTVRGMADSLRAQNHEAANRLHTIVSLIEIGRPEDAVSFATDELETVQRLTDEIVASVDHPVLSALLLGKITQAAERGIQLDVSATADFSRLPVDPHSAVTILGNLIDNAMDATTERPSPRQIEVTLTSTDQAFSMVVADSGAGIHADQRDLAFQRGWSTKTSENGMTRGVGLALVVQAVRRYGGQIEVASSHLGGAEFLVTIPAVA